MADPRADCLADADEAQEHEQDGARPHDGGRVAERGQQRGNGREPGDGPERRSDQAGHLRQRA